MWKIKLAETELKILVRNRESRSLEVLQKLGVKPSGPGLLQIAIRNSFFVKGGS